MSERQWWDALSSRELVQRLIQRDFAPALAVEMVGDRDRDERVRAAISDALKR